MILLEAITAGIELCWILKSGWLVNVPMNVFTIVIKGGTRVHWRIVMLEAFQRIFRHPTVSNKFFLKNRLKGHMDKTSLLLLTMRWRLKLR